MNRWPPACLPAPRVQITIDPAVIRAERDRDALLDDLGHARAAEAVRLYRHGMDLESVRAALDPMTEAQVRLAIATAGIPLRRGKPNLSPAPQMERIRVLERRLAAQMLKLSGLRRAEAVRLYRAGCSLYMIAHVLVVHHELVRHELVAAGVVIRSQGRRRAGIPVVIPVVSA